MSARCLAAASLLLLLGCRREVALASPPPAPTARVSADPGEPIAGIGIRPILHAHGFAVGQLFPGSPAERAGLRAGDVVTAVDGDSSARWTLERVAERLRGPAGTKVTLTLERGGSVMQMTISRDVLRAIPEVPR